MLKTVDSAALKEHLIRWRIISRPPLYGLGALLLLMLFLAIVTFLVVGIHEWLFPDTFATYWYYDAVISLFVVVLFVFVHRASLLGLSRWRPRWMDTIIGAIVGIALPSTMWLAVRDPGHSLGFRIMPASSIIPIVLTGPILEEVLFRGTILKSLKGYMSTSLSIGLCVFLAALGHSNFWVAIPFQLAVSILYAAMGDSLPASIAAHITNNAVVFFLPMLAFERWHTRLWSLWR